MIRRRDALFGSLAVGLAARAAGQAAPPGYDRAAAPGGRDPVETIDLWPAGAPGAPANLPVETVVERSTDPAIRDRAVTGIARPRLVVFRPARPNGDALLLAPGGGYARVVVDKEGYELGHWLAARGVTVFVLFYRLPGEGWARRSDVPLADAQRSVRLIRARAAAYGIDPARVAAMGFSAGGHVCGSLATRFDAPVYTAVDAADRLDARPLFAAPIYAVQSMRVPVAHAGSRDLLLGSGASAAEERVYTTAEAVTARTPPCFVVHAEDDATVPVANSLAFHDACRRAGVPVEMHLFTAGGHGFGIRGTVGKPVAIWPDLFLGWARTQGWHRAT